MCRPVFAVYNRHTRIPHICSYCFITFHFLSGQHHGSGAPTQGTHRHTSTPSKDTSLLTEVLILLTHSVANFHSARNSVIYIATYFSSECNVSVKPTLYKAVSANCRQLLISLIELCSSKTPCYNTEEDWMSNYLKISPNQKIIYRQLSLMQQHTIRENKLYSSDACA